MAASREMTDAELLAIADEAVAEVVRQAELKMDQALTMALAADQRASSLGATYGAVSAGLLAAAGTLDAIDHAKVPLVAGLAVAAAVFFAATCVCAWACRPISYFSAGNDPASVVMSADNVIGMNRLYCRELDVRLRKNAAVLARTGRWTTRAQLVAVIAPLFGIATYGLAMGCPCLFAFLGPQTS
jgi:hypothetical protein